MLREKLAAAPPSLFSGLKARRRHWPGELRRLRPAGQSDAARFTLSRVQRPNVHLGDAAPRRNRRIGPHEGLFGRQLGRRPDVNQMLLTLAVEDVEGGLAVVRGCDLDPLWAVDDVLVLLG